MVKTQFTLKQFYAYKNRKPRWPPRIPMKKPKPTPADFVQLAKHQAASDKYYAKKRLKRFATYLKNRRQINMVRKTGMVSRQFKKRFPKNPGAVDNIMRGVIDMLLPNMS